MHRMGRPKLSRDAQGAGRGILGRPQALEEKKAPKEGWGQGQSGSCESPKAKAALPLTFRLGIA